MIRANEGGLCVTNHISEKVSHRANTRVVPQTFMDRKPVRAQNPVLRQDANQFVRFSKIIVQHADTATCTDSLNLSN